MAQGVKNPPVNVTKLRRYVKARGLTVTAFAKKVGKKRDHVSHMLSGDKSISPELLNKMAEVLDVEDYVFYETLSDGFQRQSISIFEDWNDEIPVDFRGRAHQIKDFADAQDRYKTHFGIFTPEVEDDVKRTPDFWKKEAILPFRSPQCVSFWEFEGDEIIIHGPARCGKSTLILEWLIATMLKHPGMQVLNSGFRC